MKDRDTLLFKKIGTAQNFEKFLGPCCIARPMGRLFARFCLFSTISVRFQYDLISRGAIKINQFQKSLGQLNRGQLNRSAPQ